ncbi:MAG: class IV adenylate cyclase [Verrucomicrobiota bacterium]
MPTNIEIKARVRDMDRTRRAAVALADGPARILEQRDTFFACARGRLKLREFSGGSGELIAYERDDAPGAKASHYVIAPVPEPGPLRETLAQALGVRGKVTKRRELHLAGQTRIHLDTVEGLGTFLELEVVMREGQSAAEGEAIARELMARLGVMPEDLVAGAYVDLLNL